MPALEFFFDVVSPYSYLASARVDAVASAAEVDVRWRPFFLGGAMKATGNQPPATLPARGRYMLQDLQRWAAREGTPFRFPSRFPVNTILAQRALVGLEGDTLRSTAAALFHAYWAEDAAIDAPAVVAGIVGEDAAAAAATPVAKAALRAATDEAVARGAFGAPSFFVGDELFFGNDRLEWAVEAAAAQVRA